MPKNTPSGTFPAPAPGQEVVEAARAELVQLRAELQAIDGRLRRRESRAEDDLVRIVAVEERMKSAEAALRDLAASNRDLMAAHVELAASHRETEKLARDIMAELLAQSGQLREIAEHVPELKRQVALLNSIVAAVPEMKDQIGSAVGSAVGATVEENFARRDKAQSRGRKVAALALGALLTPSALAEGAKIVRVVIDLLDHFGR